MLYKKFNMFSEYLNLFLYWKLKNNIICPKQKNLNLYLPKINGIKNNLIIFFNKMDRQ
jgi:hypothetical protein